MMSVSRSIFCFLCMTLATVSANAEKLPDSDQPIKLRADRMTSDQSKNTTILEGNVYIEQGSIKIRAKRVELIQNAQGYNTLKATGSPVTFESRSDKTNRPVQGWANQVEYQEKNESVIMSGNARLVSENDEIQAKTIRYFRKTGQYSADGEKNPVYAVIQPRKKQ